MKIVGISSSPRGKNSNTLKLLDAWKEPKKQEPKLSLSTLQR